jgi:hypothetical protein
MEMQEYPITVISSDSASPETVESGVLDWKNLHKFSERLFTLLQNKNFFHLEVSLPAPARGLWLPAAQADVLAAIFWLLCEDEPQCLKAAGLIGRPVFVIARTYTARVVVEMKSRKLEIPLGSAYRMSAGGIHIELPEEGTMRLVFLELTSP